MQLKLFHLSAVLLASQATALQCYYGTNIYGWTGGYSIVTCQMTNSFSANYGNKCTYYRYGGMEHYECATDSGISDYYNDGYTKTCQCAVDLCNVLGCAFWCFDGEQTVNVKGKDGIVEKYMKDLEIGDNVHVGHGEYDQVFAFSHRDANMSSNMLHIHTDHGSIKLTPSHFLDVNGTQKAAKEVKVGDFLHRHDGSLTAVKKIEHLAGKGMYAPHTKSGNIVVNGHKASCYTEAVNPKVAHAVLSPIGALYEAGFTSAAKVVDKLMQSPTIASAAQKVLNVKK